MVYLPCISELRHKALTVYWWLQVCDVVLVIISKYSQYALAKISQKAEWYCWNYMMIHCLNTRQILGKLADIILICFLQRYHKFSCFLSKNQKKIVSFLWSYSFLRLSAWWTRIDGYCMEQIEQINPGTTQRL